MSRGSDDRMEQALRKKDKDAERIEIECVESDGDKEEGYIVTVYPRPPKNPKPSKDGNSVGYPFGRSTKHLFKTEEETLEFLKEVL